jgi:hypothetical protein
MVNVPIIVTSLAGIVCGISLHPENEYPTLVGYYVAPLRKQSKTNLEIIDELKRWAFMLDNMKGELPLWPLMEVAHEWYANTMGLAEIEEDEVTAMLCQRVS